MQINLPTWSLRGIRCQCCSGQGALCFSTCPACKAVVLICDEVGTVFQDPRDLEAAVYGGLDDPTCLCAQCGKSRLSSFRNSTSEEIQASGFSVEAYE